MRKAFLSSLEFRKQLVIAFSLGIGLLAIATSLTLTLTANQSIKSQIIDQGLYLTESIGRQSRLALLYQSPEEARDTVEIALQFPDVVGVEIKTDKGDVLHSQGGDEIPPLTQRPEHTLLANETGSALVFVTPVKTQTDDDHLWAGESIVGVAEGEIIGYVSVAISKGTLNAIWEELLKSNVFVSAVIAINLLIFLLLLTRRLTDPLRQLSEVMHRAEAGELNLRASFRGPRDIENMQKAFNTMMTSLETRTVELQKARDQALESAKIKSEFAANVSHELRTPMNSVLGMLDLLSVMGLDSQQYDYVETAKLSAHNLLALIDDILSYVRADSGRLVLDDGPCDLNTLLEDVVTLLSTQAMKKKLDIGYIIDGVDGSIILDAQRLRQILINLVGNAIKFTDSGEIQISASLTDDKVRKLRVAIRDTGIGINPDAQQKIFEAFTQEDSTTTRRYGGTGLGLAICKQFVTLMGGDITVKSEPGHGSEFEFTLPYLPAVTAAEPARPQVDLSGKQVVIADDSGVVSGFIDKWVSARGAQATCAENAVELLDYLNTSDNSDRKVDYLFVDENILGINFSDLLSVIREHSCIKGAEIIIMVNPWIITYHSAISQCSIIEKPILYSKLNNLFTNDKVSGNSRQVVRDRKNLLAKKLNLKVLVVDDNQANCLVAGGMLDQMGCEYEFVYNGKDAIERVSRKSFDLVLMDCNMPVMDGYEAVETIRRLEGEVSTLPVIAMTANNSVEEKERCLAAGMNDFIAKPLSVESLFRVLESCHQDGVEYVAETVQSSAKSSKKYSFDLAVVKELQASVGEVFGSVVEAFVEDTPAYLESLKSAIGKGDSQQVYELSHTIKGSAANFGSTRVSSLAKLLEDKGRAGDILGSDRLYTQLVANVDELIDDLKRFSEKNKISSFGADGDKNVSTILVADDDRSIRLAFSNALRDEGYRILEAANGQSVLALCSRTMPDLILIDAIMPEVDGFSACKQIREMANGTDVPILMVTSLEDEQSISRAFMAGATDYITKPANFSVLRQRVARLLQTSKVEKHVRKLAYQDVLTGLPNRAFFNQQLRHKISRANLNNKKIALLFLDLDRFKLINDSLGHDTGDLILKAAAERISNCVRKNDLVARLGGDEFTIVLEDVDLHEVAGEISRKISESLARPFVFLHQKLFVSASIGIAVFPDDGHTIGELVKRADIAMFKAKETGSSYCYYQQGMEDEVLERLEIERGIRNAIERNEILLHYQPQIDLHSGRIRGVEALVRWQHPEKGILPAGDFIPVIEESGLIGELDGIVFREACRQLSAWHAAGHKLRVAVNVSGVEFQDGRFREQILGLLAEYRFPPEYLEVEITESVLMDQPEVVQDELAKIREHGICIAIDDFGSGFSSLNYLKNFSVDIIKIDREFIRDCHRDKNDQAIILGIIALAKNLNLKIVAEGVENEEQMAFLRTTGCDYAQGFHLGRPMNTEDLAALIGIDEELPR